MLYNTVNTDTNTTLSMAQSFYMCNADYNPRYKKTKLITHLPETHEAVLLDHNESSYREAFTFEFPDQSRLLVDRKFVPYEYIYEVVNATEVPTFRYQQHPKSVIPDFIVNWWHACAAGKNETMAEAFYRTYEEYDNLFPPEEEYAYLAAEKSAGLGLKFQTYRFKDRSTVTIGCNIYDFDNRSPYFWPDSWEE